MMSFFNKHLPTFTKVLDHFAKCPGVDDLHDPDDSILDAMDAVTRMATFAPCKIVNAVLEKTGLKDGE